MKYYKINFAAIYSKTPDYYESWWRISKEEISELKAKDVFDGYPAIYHHRSDGAMLASFFVPESDIEALKEILIEEIYAQRPYNDKYGKGIYISDEEAIDIISKTMKEIENL